jgi:hypothetical protein
MPLRVVAGLLAVLPLLADVGADRDPITYLLAHIEENGKLFTRIYAFQNAAHKVCWTFDTGDTFEVRPARVGRFLFVPNGRAGWIHCLDAVTGRELWSIGVEPYRCMLPVDERTFVLCCRNTRISCYVREGRGAIRRWERDLPIQAREVWRIGDRLYIPTYRNVLCVSLKTGREIWDFVPLQGECLYVRPAGREIFVWDWWKQDVFSLDAESGKLLWHKSVSASPCVLGQSGSFLLMTYSGGRVLQAVDAQTGKEEWVLQRMDLQRTLPPADDLAYHPFIRPLVFGGAAYVVIEEQKLARCSVDRGLILEEWNVRAPILGVAALPDAILVAIPDRWIVYRKNGEKITDVRVPGALRYLRAID